MKKSAKNTKPSHAAAGGFAGERMAEAAKKQPSKTMKKSVTKFKPGAK